MLHLKKAEFGIRDQWLHPRKPNYYMFHTNISYIIISCIFEVWSLLGSNSHSHSIESMPPFGKTNPTTPSPGFVHLEVRRKCHTFHSIGNRSNFHQSPGFVWRGLGRCSQGSKDEVGGHLLRSVPTKTFISETFGKIMKDQWRYHIIYRWLARDSASSRISLKKIDDNW